MFFQYQKNKNFEESEKVFTKYLLPVHQRFSSHKALFKQFPCLALETKIKIYTMKVIKNFEKAKNLSENENTKFEQIQISEEFLKTNDIDYENVKNEISELQSIDLDYETIHSEILENIIFDENESGLSDFDENNNETEEGDGISTKQPSQIFNIVKIKNIIKKSVASLFEKEQKTEEFLPLFEQEKDIKKNLDREKKENKLEYLSNNTELKTQDNTEYIKDNLKENDNNNEKEENEEDTIINYKKYNYWTDPNSNYNNFTKKYEIKQNPKKRFRDIHPFLKTFNPKFLKKENIDKKIFRRFRKFVRTLYKTNKNLPLFKKNPLFWQKFYSKNLLPPVKIRLNQNGQLIEHKSFNTQYLIWLFNQEGTSELFEMFAKNESENVIKNFIEEYDLNESKEPDIVGKIREYIKYIPEIYCCPNYCKKIILQENHSNLEINNLNNGEEEDLDSIESGISSSNPFNLRFDEIGKKNFKEISYDNSDSFVDNNFFLNKTNNFNEDLIRRSDSPLSKYKYFDDADNYYFYGPPKRSFFEIENSYLK